jgi:hypothetical protein
MTSSESVTRASWEIAPPIWDFAPEDKMSRISKKVALVYMAEINNFEHKRNHF